MRTKSTLKVVCSCSYPKHTPCQTYLLTTRLYLHFFLNLERVLEKWDPLLSRGSSRSQVASSQKANPPPSPESSPEGNHSEQPCFQIWKSTPGLHFSRFDCCLKTMLHSICLFSKIHACYEKVPKVPLYIRFLFVLSIMLTKMPKISRSSGNNFFADPVFFCVKRTGALRIILKWPQPPPPERVHLFHFVHAPKRSRPYLCCRWTFSGFCLQMVVEPNPRGFFLFRIGVSCTCFLIGGGIVAWNFYWKLIFWPKGDFYW